MKKKLAIVVLSIVLCISMFPMSLLAEEQLPEAQLAEEQLPEAQLAEEQMAEEQLDEEQLVDEQLFDELLEDEQEIQLSETIIVDSEEVDPVKEAVQQIIESITPVEGGNDEVDLMDPVEDILDSYVSALPQSVKTNRTTLKNYILKYGSENSSGDMFIRYTHVVNGSTLTAAIIYSSTNKEFTFISFVDDNEYIKMTMGENSQNVSVQYLSVDLLIDAKVTFDASSYTETTNLYFRQDEYYAFTDSEIRELCNSRFKLALTDWDLLLYRTFGLEPSMKSLGFTKYGDEIKVKSISLNRSSLEMITKSSKQLKVKFNPSDATNQGITWSSSNKNIATVNQSGKVTAKARGKVTISATSKADKTKKATCKITVKYFDAYYDLDGTGNSNVTKGMETAINWAADNKITGEKESFGTKNSMTRGQFVRFLYRYAGNPEVTTTMIKKYGSKFKDVDKNYTHYNAIVWAVSKGLIDGYTENGKQVFKPGKSLSRNNVATILWKFAGKPKVKNANKPFSDVTKSAALAWGKNKGIFTGTKFKPKENCLRGDFAVFLYRYDKNVK